MTTTMKKTTTTKANLSNNKAEFRIYKEGRTMDGPVVILSRNDEPFDKVAKMEFYKMLGYTILPL